jgi:hypothetical protein
MCLEHTVAVEGVDPLLVLGVYPLLWPTLIGTEAMTWLKIQVHDARRSTLTTEVFVHESRAGDREAVEFHIEAVRAVNSQDEVPNTGVSTGLRSRYAVPSTLHPLEAAVAHFSEWYRSLMGPA